jgi:hypothetical protein
MPAFAPVLRPEVAGTGTAAPEVVAAAAEEPEVELDFCDEDVLAAPEESIELEALDEASDEEAPNEEVLGMEELVVDIMAEGGFEVVLLVVGFTELVVVGCGVGVVVVVVVAVVVVGEGVLVSTVPKVNPGKRLMDSPVAAGRRTWLPRVGGPSKATFRLLSSVGQ